MITGIAIYFSSHSMTPEVPDRSSIVYSFNFSFLVILHSVPKITVLFGEVGLEMNGSLLLTYPIICPGINHTGFGQNLDTCWWYRENRLKLWYVGPYFSFRCASFWACTGPATYLRGKTDQMKQRLPS